MTDLDNATAAEPLNLTGSALCPGQKQGGNFRTITDREYVESYGWEGLTDEECMRLARYQHQDEQRYRWKCYSFPRLTMDEMQDRELIMLKSIAITEKRIADRPKIRSHAGNVLGAREFTLTYSPKWCTDTEARLGMQKAIEKLCRYYADEIVELRAVGEVGSNGMSHIHCFYKLRQGLKITDKNFKRAWSYWNPKKKLGHGFEGGHHATVKEESDFRGYIEKDIDSAWYEKSLNNIV